MIQSFPAKRKRQPCAKAFLSRRTCHLSVTPRCMKVDCSALRVCAPLRSLLNVAAGTQQTQPLSVHYKRSRSNPFCNDLCPVNAVRKRSGSIGRIDPLPLLKSANMGRIGVEGIVHADR